jgi:hypothetical protein
MKNSKMNFLKLNKKMIGPFLLCAMLIYNIVVLTQIIYKKSIWIPNNCVVTKSEYSSQRNSLTKMTSADSSVTASCIISNTEKIYTYNEYSFDTSIILPQIIPPPKINKNIIIYTNPASDNEYLFFSLTFIPRLIQLIIVAIILIGAGYVVHKKKRTTK